MQQGFKLSRIVLLFFVLFFCFIAQCPRLRVCVRVEIALLDVIDLLPITSRPTSRVFFFIRNASNL